MPETLNLLSTAEAARILGISKATVLLYVKAGRLASSCYARKFKFQDADLRDFLRANKRGR